MNRGPARFAVLMGGAIEGGRVLTDRPHLDRGRLYQGRNLAPTMDLRALANGVLTDHLHSKDIGGTLRAWSPSGSRLDRIAVGFRMMIATLIDIRADLAFTDPILGVDVRGLFAPASFRDLAMVRWQTQSWCAQDRQRGFWQP